MNAEEWRTYLEAIQDNRAIDLVSLGQYTSLVSSLNTMVRNAAAKHLNFENEPARFTRTLHELSE